MPQDNAKRRPSGVDLNILPASLRRPQLELTMPSLAGLSVTFWLLVILAALILVYFFQFQAKAQGELAQKQAVQRTLDAEVQRRKALPAEVDKLQAALTQTVQLSWGLEDDYQTLVAGKAFWAGVLESILGSRPPGIELTNIAQRGNQVLLNGVGETQASVTVFANNLKKTARFASVTVQSLTEQPPPPPTPIT